MAKTQTTIRRKAIRLTALASFVVLAVVGVFASRPLFAADPVTWTGATSTDWFTTTNWSTGAIPTPADAVVIDGGTRQPTLNLASGSVTVASLVLGGTTSSTLTISNGAPTTNELIVSGDMQVKNLGIVTQAGNGTTITNRLAIKTGGNLTIDTGGIVRANGGGFPGGSNSIAGYGPGGSPASGVYAYGAAYGGNAYSNPKAYGSYLLPRDAGSGATGTAGGAGGGAVELTVQGDLTVNGTLSSNGNASGAQTDQLGGGGGSGGSLLVTAATIHGAGTVSANGGIGARVYGTTDQRNSNGAGGRVALYADTTTFTGTLSAAGGRSASGRTPVIEAGGAGTVYVKNPSQQHGSMLIDATHNLGAIPTTPQLAASVVFDELTVKNGASYTVPSNGSLEVTSSVGSAGSTTVSVANLIFGTNGQLKLPAALTLNKYTITGSPVMSGAQASLDLTDTSIVLNTTSPDFVGAGTDVTLRQGGLLNLGNRSTPASALQIKSLAIQSGGRMTASANTASILSSINLDVSGAVTVQSGGSIDVNSLGYGAGLGSGAGQPAVTTSSGAGGAGYGGIGGAGSSPAAGGAAYGATDNPVEAGSGGGQGTSGVGAGAGGGALRIVAGGAVEVNGSVTANGQTTPGTATTQRGGGGSGGSIFITAPNVSGSGLMSATGGNGIVGASGGGAGGRIRIERAVAAPVISNLSITRAGITGGQTLTITGQHFTEKSKVQISIQGATDTTTVDATTTYIDEQTLQVIVPAVPHSGQTTVSVVNQDLVQPIALDGGTGYATGAAGTLYPSQHNANLFASTEDFQYYEAPVITSVSPSSATGDSGSTVVLTGQHFRAGAEVRFGHGVYVPAANVTDTTIAVNLPVSLELGPVPVVVRNEDGQSYTIRDSFSYVLPSPTISAVSPASGPSAGGNTVVIEGSNLTGQAVFVQTVLGSSHACGLTAGGQVYCWGAGSNGQLGLGSTSSATRPTRVEGLVSGKKIVALAAGDAHTLAVDNMGRVYAWGSNADGRLGLNTSGGNYTTPTAVYVGGALTGKTITQVAAGQNHSLALDSAGNVYAWGAANQGRLGTGDATEVSAPKLVTVLSSAGKRINSIAAGTHSLAVDDAGIVYSWGYNSNGQLGNGASSSTVAYGTPTAVTTAGTPMAGKKIVAVSASYYHTLAIDDEGVVYAWGSNSAGQLGDGVTATAKPLPQAVVTAGTPMAGKKIVSVAAGLNYSLAAADDGSAYAWGAGGNGQLGNNSSANERSPVSILGGLPFSSVAASISSVSSCGVALQTGYCWGFNTSGQVGDASGQASVPTPSAISRTNLRGDLAVSSVRFDTNATPIVSYTDTSITVTAPAHAPGVVDLTLTGAFIDSTTAQDAYEYTAPPTLTSISPTSGLVSGGDTAVLTGVNFSVGSTVTVGGTAATITNTTQTTITVTIPAHIAGTYDVVVTSASGQSSTLTGAFTYRNLAPVVRSVLPTRGPVAGGQIVTVTGESFGLGSIRFSQVAAGYQYSIGLGVDGKVYAWGNGSSGTLGNGSSTSSNVPVAVSTSGVLAGKTVTAIAAGGSHILALTSEGKVYAWGVNGNGQLGNGSSTNSNVPVAVSTSGVLAGKTVTAIAAGASHSLALASDGKVYAWGQGDYGQLGNGSSTSSNVPVAVSTSGVLAGKTVTAIAAGLGGSHSLVIADDGKAYTWGDGAGGTLGNGSSTNSNVPVAVSTSGVLAGKTVTAIAAGINFSLVLTSEGSAYSWGFGGSGRLGNGSSTNSNVPVAVSTSGVLAGKTVTAIAANTGNALVLASNGQLYSWGANSYGQLGDGSVATNSDVPVAVTTSGVLAGKTIKTIGMGDNHALALDAEGSVFTWGRGDQGQLGDSRSTSAGIPVAVLPPETLVPSVTLNGIRAINVTYVNSTTLNIETPTNSPGLVDISVANPDGQSNTLPGAYEYVAPPSLTSVTPSIGYVTGGDAVVLTGANFSTNSTVTIGGTSATIVDQSATSITVLTPASTVGHKDVVVTDAFGQASTLTSAFTYRELPPVITSITPIRGPASGGQDVVIRGEAFGLSDMPFESISSGGTHTLGVGQDGLAYAWGINSSGQLGNGTGSSSSVPVATRATGVLAGKTVVAVAAGANHSLALTSDGRVYSWGANSYGQLGDGTITSRTIPVAVSTSGVLAGKTVVAIAAGVQHSLALTSDGRVYSWGNGTSGQLGNGVNGDSSSPVAVSIEGVLAGKVVKAISTSGNHSLALATDGRVYAWGMGTSGQLGNGANTTRTIPVAVATSGVLAGKTVTAIAGGGNHSLALASDGRVYSWGNSQYTGSNTSGSTAIMSPVAVTTSGVLAGKTVIGIAAGISHSLALTSDGGVYSWGLGNNGQLGDGSSSATAALNPVAVTMNGALASKAVALVSSGSSNSSAAITSDGGLYAWGAGTSGQIGDGSSANRYTPVKTTSPRTLVPTLTLNGENLRNVTYVNTTTFNAKTPSGAPGVADLTITNPDGQADTLQDAYEYVAAPTLTTLAPSSGSISGGESIYLSGSNFTENTTVRFGSATAVKTFINSTTLLVTAPASINPGAVTVTVTDEFGQASSLTNGYVYRLPAPAIISVAPLYGKMAGGTQITITGSGFVSRSGGGSWYSVLVDGVEATGVTFVNATTLRALVPAHALGVVDVTIGGDYSDSVTLSDAYTYLPDAYEFTTSPQSLMATEPGSLTVRALDANGQPVEAMDDIILHLSSSSANGFFARSLTGQGAGWDYDTVAIPAGSNSATFYYRDMAPGTPTITVADNAGTSATQQQTITSRFKLLVTGVSNPISAGVPSSITVQAVDYTGAPQSDYQGTIQFTTDDGAATLPANYTFVPTDHGRKTFINGVTMGTVGVWDVDAVDLSDANVNGSQLGVVVEAPASGTIGQLKFITPPQSFALDQTSGVITVQAQDMSGLAIPVAQDTPIYVRSSSSTGQFSVDGGASWANAPSAVTIPAGSSHLNVLYRDTTAGTYTLKGSQQPNTDFGWQVATQQVVVGVGSPAKLAIQDPGVVAIGEWFPVDVALTDTSGNIVTSPGDVEVSLTASQNAEISLLADGSSPDTQKNATILTGQQYVRVWIQATSGTEVVLAVSDARGLPQQDTYDSATRTIQLGEAEPVGFVFSSLPAQTPVHTATPVHVSLRDQFGNIISAREDTEVTLTSNSSDASYSETNAGPWVATRSATIAPGATTTPTYFRQLTVNDAVELRASGAGLEDGVGTIQVVAAAYAGKLRFAPTSSSQVVAGSETDFTVELLDAYGNPTVATQTVQIGFGSSRSGQATWNGVTAINPNAPATGYTLGVPAGEGTVTATYRDTLAGEATLQAFDQARWQRSCVRYSYTNGPCVEWSSWTNDSRTVQTVMVGADAPVAYAITTDPRVVTKNTPSLPITVELHDQFENLASFTSGTQAALTTTGVSAGFSRTVDGNYTDTALAFNAGQTSTTVYYKGAAVSSQSGDTITVSGNNVASVDQTIRVVEGFAEQATIDTEGRTTVVAGEVIPVTIRALTADDLEVVVLQDTTLSLSSDKGEFSLTDTPFTPITSLTLRAETSNRPLFYRSTAAGLTALRAQGGSLEASASELTIVASDFYKLSYTQLPTGNRVEVAKASQAFVAGAYDEFGNVVVPDSTSDTDVALSSSRTQGEFSLSSSAGWGVSQTSISSGNTTTRPFYYRIGTINGASGALDDPSVLGEQIVGATTGNALPAEATIRTVGALATRVVVTSAPQTVRAGESSQPVTVQLQNTDGTPAVATSDQTITLSSLNLEDSDTFAGVNGNDVFSATPGGDPVTSILVPAGSSKAQFYATPQTAEKHRLRVGAVINNYDGAYLRTVSATQEITVIAGNAARLTFASTEQVVHPSKVSGVIKIALTDTYGNAAVNESNRTVSLASSCSTGQFLASPTGPVVTSLAMDSGENEVYAYYRDSAASAAPCVITISASGLTPADQDIVVREPVFGFAITSAQQTVAAGQTSAPIIVETRDRFGNTVTAEDPIVVTLSATGADHTIAPLQRTIQRGSSTAQFTFRHDVSVDAATTYAITAQASDPALVLAQQDITVVPGAVSALEFTAPSFTDIVGEYRALKVQTLNAYGKRAPAGSDITASLATTSGNGAFYRRVDATYVPITSTTVLSGRSQSETVYYRQTQTTRQQNGNNTPVTVTVSSSGLVAGTAQATLNAKTLSFSTGSFGAQASSYTPIRVTLSTPLTEALTVTLSTTSSTGTFSTEENDSSVVTTTVIPAGQTQSPQLYYRQTDQTSGNYPETLRAAPGAAPVSVWAGSVTASFYANQFSQLIFINPVVSLEQNQPATMTIEARDDLGNVVPFTNSLAGYCLYVNSSSSAATFTTSGNAQRGCVDTAGKKAIYVSRYQTRVTFGYKDTAVGTQTIAVANNSGSGGVRVSTDVTITDAITTKVSFDRSLYSLVRGDEQELAIRLTNNYDYLVNTLGDTTVTLTSDSPSGRFYDSLTSTWAPSLNLTIAAGMVEQTGIRYTDSTSNSTTTIRASTEELPEAQATIALGVGPVSGVVFKNSPTTIERGQQGVFTVGFVDAFGNETPATSDFCLYARSSNGAGTFTTTGAQGGCQDMTLPGGEISKAIAVRAGETEVALNYQSFVAGEVTITVSTLPTGGGLTASQVVTVVDGAPARVGFEPSESELERGGVLDGRVVLYNAYGAEVPATNELTVRLTGSINDGSFATSGDGPWAGTLDVSIPVDSSNATFLYQTGAEYLGDVTLNATPSDTDLGAGSGTVTVTMGDVAQLVFATPELTTTATHPSSVMTIEAKNRYGVTTVADSNTVLYVRSSSTTGTFATGAAGPWNTNTIQLLAGQSSVDAYYRDETVGTHTVTVRDKLSPQQGEQYLMTSQEHHIVRQEFSHFIVTNISSPTRTGIASSVVVFAVDSENYVVSWYDGTITFTSDDSTAVLPRQSYTFQPDVDRGIHTFTNGVAFRTPGIKSVTATDQSGRQGTQFDIEVLAGNSAPVRAIAVTDPVTQEITLDKNQVSSSFALELRDEAGAATNAPTGGMPIRLVSDSLTGEFSTDGTSWSTTLVTTVEAGLSFSTTPVYYRDSAGGSHTITVQDWLAGVDSALIQNATITAHIRELGLEATQKIYAIDYTGAAIENPYLFSRNKQGLVGGHTTITAESRDLITGDSLVSDWSVTVGGTSESRPGLTRLDYTSPALSPQVGDIAIPAVVQATSGSLTSVWQGEVPVSPWRAALENVTLDDTVFSGTLATYRDGIATDSAQATIQVMGGVNQVTRTWSVADLLTSGLAQQVSAGSYSFRVPLTLFSGGDYTILVQLGDGVGVTAQDSLTLSVSVPQTPDTPGIPSVPPIGPTGPGGNGGGVISPETPGDPSTRPEQEAPVPPREGAYEDQQPSLLQRILEAPETPIRVAQTLLGVLLIVAIVLLYQMYREYRHARLIAAIIRRDNETLANKNGFLQLASHHLRTPLTLLSASSEVLSSIAQSSAQQASNDLAQVIRDLQTKVENILTRTNTSQEIALIVSQGDEPVSQRKVYLSPVFWLPVILSIALTMIANWAVSAYGGQDISLTTYANQIILLALGVVLVYTAVRMLAMRRERRLMLERSQAKSEALNEAKISFARQVGRELADDVLHLTAHAQNVAMTADPAAIRPLEEGVERLERLVGRFSLMENIYASRSAIENAPVELVVEQALHTIQQEYPRATVSIAGNTEGAIEHQPRWLIVKLLQNIAKGMVPATGEGAITIDARQSKQGTTLSVTGPAAEDAPAEDLFSVYSQSSQESAGTYNTEEADGRMQRLDLFLDRMIADELAADLSSKHMAGQTQVTVRIPNL